MRSEISVYNESKFLHMRKKDFCIYGKIFHPHIPKEIAVYTRISPPPFQLYDEAPLPSLRQP